MSKMTTMGRIDSIDQFRGYTVAGMIVVNFLGVCYMTSEPAILRHHNTYFSYADTIMPSFMFACGFSYRLTISPPTFDGNREDIGHVSAGPGAGTRCR